MGSKASSFSPLRIIADTREQKPYSFEKYDAEVIRHGLKTGDYSLAGYEDRIALERKSLDDFVGSITKDRERFVRELERARGLEYFAVIVEASMDDIRYHRYRSQVKPKAVLNSIFAFEVRYGHSFILAGSREGGEFTTHGLLEKYKKEQEAKASAGTMAASGAIVVSESRQEATIH